MHLLREWHQIDYKTGLIAEERGDGTKKILLRGIIQKADCRNQNRRIYPRSLLRREVESYQKAIRENRAVGQLDHPEDSTVSLEKVSHIVREAHWEGDDVVGTVEILGTPCGKIAEQLIRDGVVLGISSRGVGSTSKNESGLDTVQDDYQLVCWDLVAEPSTPGAFLSLSESRVVRPPSLTRPDRVFRALNRILLVDE